MFGVIANSLAIAGGCIVGLIIKGGLPQRVSDTIMNGIALCVLYIGISGALEGKHISDNNIRSCRCSDRRINRY